MPLRATSTSRRASSWKDWLLLDYARYWYVLGVIALLVFGVAEAARVGASLDALDVAGLLSLAVAIVAGGVIGYLLLWRRDTRTAQGILRFLLRRGPPVEDVPPARVATPPSDEDAGGDLDGPG